MLRALRHPIGLRMRSSSLTLSARYVFPTGGAPIADGCVAFRDGRISWVGPATERTADLDLGNVAVVPGFVNAHTHLELSALASDPGGTSDQAEDEVKWLRRVVDSRRSRT